MGNPRLTLLPSMWISNYLTLPVTRASSDDRCNTIQCIDSTMLARENHLFGCTRSKPGQSSVPARLILTSYFSICFQCQAGSSLVLRRPIEITRQTRHKATFEVLPFENMKAQTFHGQRKPSTQEMNTRRRRSSPMSSSRAASKSGTAISGCIWRSRPISWCLRT
jgi:hypothetical protein